MKKRKANSQRAHFIRRVKLRFGLYLTDHDVELIIQLIKTDQSEVVEKQSNRVVVHAVTYQDEFMHVCYDKQRGELITALLPGGNPLT